MNQDLKIIKNKYGEKMMHLCRNLFSTILETEGVLSKIMLEKFEPTKFLYEDIIQNNLIEEFSSCIYSAYDSPFMKKVSSEKTPKELLSEAGYDLYECNTEEEIQKFKKYYKKFEELCTFKGGRLDKCHVFFAVKKDVENIKRENFPKPERQDEYATSVLSIQFTKDEDHILSIKNRYNHKVDNPDATFSNNLDNIIPGLTDSFEKFYGMIQKFKYDEFDVNGYVMANDGKYYKYNMEIDNVYYCSNNIIIDNFEVKRYPKDKYIVMDQFILDLKSGNITSYKENIDKSFEKSMEDSGRPVVYNCGEYKKIVFYNKEPIVIILDNLNNIVGLQNKNIKEIGPYFLYYNKKIEKISLPNVEIISHNFLVNGLNVKEIDIKSVKEIGRGFLYNNEDLEEIELPVVKEIEHNFLRNNKKLKRISIPSNVVEQLYKLYKNIGSLEINIVEENKISKTI